MNRILASSVLLSTMACGGDVAVTKVDSEVGVSPEVIDFGAVPVGSVAESTIELWIIEGNEANLMSMTFPGDSEGVFGWDEVGGIIPVGNVLEVDMSFAPLTPGPYISDLRLLTDNDGVNRKTLTIRGQALEAGAERWPAVLDLGVADAFRGVDHLALQIREVYRVVVHDPQRANPCGREIHQKRCAQAPCTDHQDPGFQQFLLPGTADFGQHDMPGVTLYLIFGKIHRACRSGSGRPESAGAPVCFRKRLDF